MKDSVLELKKYGSALGLRELAKEISVNLKNAISKEEHVILDFDKVESVSSSFADELIAKVMFEVGQKQFITYVKIRNANDFIKTMINTSVIERIQTQK